MEINKKNNKRKNTFLSFKIGNEIFAVTVHKVLEVLQKQHITVIPNAPEYIKGVFNFRGNIIPAIETRLKFGLPERDVNEKYVIIVFDVQLAEKRMVVGAVADSVRDVISFEESQIQAVPELGISYNTEFLRGMLKSGDGFTMILDIDKVFSQAEINILKETGMKAGKLEEKSDGETDKNQEDL